MKITAIRSHRLYKPVMLGIALLLFTVALMNSYYMNYHVDRNKVTTPGSPGEAVIRRTRVTHFFKEPNELTDDDFAKITEFSLSRVEISDLKLLEKFVNLEELSLYRLNYSQQDLPKWKSYLGKFGIELSNGPSLNIGPLKKLSKLRKLRIYETLLSDIRPLAGLTKLESLDLGHTQVSDIKPLSGLINLQTLYLARTQVSDLRPLKELKNLQSLSIISPHLTNLEPLKGLTNLQSLYIERTPVANLEPLKGLTNLQSLRIYDTQVSDLTPLKGLKNLQYLETRKSKNISVEQVEDLQKALPNLKIF